MESPLPNPVGHTLSAHRGDDPSTWVDLHGDVLYLFAILRVRERDVAEDLVQETFLAALQAASPFKSESSMRTWLIGIMKHKIIDHFRRHTVELRASDVALWEEEDDEVFFDRTGHWKRPLQDWKDSPEALVENGEFWTIFQLCLSTLPEAHRRAFILKEIDGMNSEEICGILSISPANLWVMLHRSRSKLRKCLDARWFGGSPKEVR